MGTVVKVENFNVETLFGHGVLRSKHKLQLNVDTFDKLELNVELSGPPPG